MGRQRRRQSREREAAYAPPLLPEQAEQAVQLAELAALLLDEHGHHSYEAAKRSAARRLNIAERDAARLDNRQVAEALRRRQDSPEALQALCELRQEALRAMSLLADFEPRAVGALVDGVCRGEPGFTLHLFADAPEQVLLFLDARQIPVRPNERRLRFSGARELEVPAFEFHAGPWRVSLLVFAPEAAREAPLAEIDGRPQRRLGRAQLEALLQAD